MRRIQFLIATASVLFHLTVSAQLFPAKNYPKGYFRSPLDIPMSLAGNFGELRPNHFHMGLDLKTDRRENLRVHASADGYISRIKIEAAGFGRAIYIDHPNGYTTLYAHLNDFVPALEDYLKQQQYEQQSWSVFLTLPANLFPVKKGDLIAYSGNTGGSQAPHVHFEIRRTADDVNLNPMLFGFPIPDNTRPSILRLAIYDRTKSVYEQSPRMIPVKGAGGSYSASPYQITTTSPLISVAVTAYDTHTGSSNLNGVYEATLFDNGRPVSGFQMDGISYNDTRYLNAHIDYKTKTLGGPYLQQLSPLPGYINSIYKTNGGSETIDLSDGEVHTINISVRDAYGNDSELKFAVRYDGNPRVNPAVAGKTFYPLMLDVYESDDCEFFMGENCLYDSVHIKDVRTLSSNPAVVSAVHSIGAYYVPLQDNFVVRLRVNSGVAPEKRAKVVMQRFSGSNKEVQKVEWQKEWAAARFRDFGSFQLVVDEMPPVIVPIGISNGAVLTKSSRISFTVRDNLERFKNFRAELDGNWLRFTNDKGKIFHYRFDERCPPGKHTLRVTVEDEAGNRAEEVYEFVR